MLLYKERPNASRLFCSNIKQKSDIQLRERLKKQKNESADLANPSDGQNRVVVSIPSSFGQNENNAFVIRGAEAYDGMDIRMFNRYGKEVFRDESYRNDWKGQGLDGGVYYYLISMKNGSKVDIYRGWLLLIRR